MKKGGIILLMLALLSGELFCGRVALAQAQPAVVINEIAWMGTTQSANNEWLELKNLTNQPISLTGWTLRALDGQPSISLNGTLEANGFYLLERTDDEAVPAVKADQIYIGSLGNAGETLELKDAAGLLVDRVEASSSWPAGDNTTKATMERDAALNWQTSLMPGGTPRAENSVWQAVVIVPGGELGSSTDPGTQGLASTTLPGTGNTEPAANSQPIVLPAKAVPQAGEVVINEIVSDPHDGEPEWVELYLNSNREFDLDGWTLEDGSKAKTILSGRLNGNRRFLTIDNPKGNLNNSGDLLLLRDERGQLLDQLAYGNWPGATVAAPRDGQALARRFDGVTSFNNQADFSLTETPTKGEANQLASPTASGSEAVTAKPINYKDLIISELLPDPAGSDETGEWIELHNRGSAAMNLKDWRLGLGDHYYTFASGTLEAGDYRLVSRSESRLALLNTGATLKLYPPASQSASQSVHYAAARTGQGYAIASDGLWHWTVSPTPAAANLIKKANEPPQAEMYFETPAEVGQLVLFDSSDTVDPDGDSLSYDWQFGDGATSSQANPQHAYVKPGNYRIRLTVRDGQSQESLEKHIRINKPNRPAQAAASNANNVSYPSGLIINELLPNPAGEDSADEWTELSNIGRQPINLLGWQLDNGEGGSKPYQIEEELVIEPGGYAVFERPETGIALRNASGQVRLSDPTGRLADQVSYGKANEELAWARTDNGQWQWTSLPTPGAANRINYQGNSQKAKKPKGSKTRAANTRQVAGELAVSGRVTSLPGQLASQYFYIENQDGGYQVYNYRKDFPKLELGELITVSAQSADVNGEARLKPKDASTILVAGRATNLKPQKIGAEEVGEKYLSRLVAVSGELTKRSGSSLYLDDGTDEVLVYIKQSTGLKAADFKLGSRYQISGVLVNTKTGYRLLPRQAADIVPLSGQAQLYGYLATSTNEQLAPRSRFEALRAYIWLVVSSSVVLLVGWWLRKRITN